MKTRHNFVQIVFKCPTFSIPCSGMVYHNYESSYCCIITISLQYFYGFLGQLIVLLFSNGYQAFTFICNVM